MLTDLPKYKLASRQWKSNKTIIDVKGCQIGGDELFLIAGPCAVESEDQIEKSHLTSVS